MSERFAKFADELFSAVEGYLARALGPLRVRLQALEDREPAPGKDGRDGRDASSEDVAAAVHAALEAAMARMPPAKDGRDGKSVELAEVERLVRDAVAALPKPADGIDGAPGRNGEDGRDGEPGRDAALIEPLPMIDPQRRYARGTWAKHADGLWLARTATEGMAGWDCIVTGLAALEVSLEDAREVVVRSVRSDGQEHIARLVLPSMEYRGIWRERDYRHGDTVTWDGSLWHCERATRLKPGTPASAEDWKLCAKRGANGKDGDKGDKGDPGKDGRPGRDLTQMGPDGTRY
jgi:hypothetical protein